MELKQFQAFKAKFQHDLLSCTFMKSHHPVCNGVYCWCFVLTVTMEIMQQCRETVLQ